MAVLVNHYCGDVGFFRWHDSGDIQDAEHLGKICEVCELTPGIRHWIPTRENRLVKEYAELHPIPSNLVIRMSAPLVDKGLKNPANGLPFSTIHSREDIFPEAYKCPALHQDNKCGDCRACWDANVTQVSYHLH